MFSNFKFIPFMLFINIRPGEAPVNNMIIFVEKKLEFLKSITNLWLISPGWPNSERNRHRLSNYIVA